MADWITECLKRGAATCPICRGHTEQDPARLRINHDLDDALAALRDGTGGGALIGGGGGGGVGEGAPAKQPAAADGPRHAIKDAATLSRACYDGDEATALAHISPDTVNVGLPLTHACMRGLEAVALRIIDAGGNVNPVQLGGGNPLTWACWNKMELVALKLIEKGADVNYMETSAPRNTPLTNAAYQCLDLVALRMIDKGASVNLRNGSGRSPLQQCAGKEGQQGMARVIDALRAKGAV
jgi:hypothetical protein